jgi:hypothetical protein
MKDLVSCFSEHAVRISDVACSGSTAANAASVATTVSRPATEAGGAGAAVMSGVMTVYRSRLTASGKVLLFDVTWSRTPDGPVLSVAIHDASASSTSLMTHKYRGRIIVLSINKSVEPNEEQKVLMSSFDQRITVNTSKQVFRSIW